MNYLPITFLPITFESLLSHKSTMVIHTKCIHLTDLSVGGIGFGAVTAGLHSNCLITI
jgi:hypothetical protein